MESHNKVLSRVDSDLPYSEYTQGLPLSDDREYHDQNEIGPEPSLDYSRKTWWDSLVAVYIPGGDQVARLVTFRSSLKRKL